MPTPSPEELRLLEQKHRHDREGRLFVHLADAYLKSGDLERAREVLDQGMRESGESPQARLLFAQMLIDSAKKVCEQVIREEPENEGALRSLAELEFAAGRRTESLAYYRALIRLDPGDNAVRARINSLSAKEEFRAAEPSMEKFRRRSTPPSPPETAEGIVQQADAIAPVAGSPATTGSPSPIGAQADVVALTDLLVRIIESREGASGPESGLANQLARAIGEELGMDGAKLEVLSLSALLANLGAYPGARFNSPADAVKDPRASHPGMTAELLRGLSVPLEVIDAVRHQHERWDGGGLPAGLREEEIPNAARIISVARACAQRLTGGFGSRPQTVLEALSELQQEAGTLYDPVIVSVLRRAFRRRAEHGIGYGFGGRVLLVHSDEPRAVGLATMLHRRGYVAEIVTEASRARASLRERRTTAIILGAGLPRADLLGFIRDLRNTPAVSGTRLIIVDANDLDLRVELLAAGADACFATEADPRELMGALDALLRRAEVDPAEAL